MATYLTDENFEKEINSAEKLALVDFFADWCGPCHMLTPVLEKVAEEMKDEIVLLKANLDEVPRTAGKFGVEKIPTVILFKQGKPISGFVGLAPESSIKDWIKNILDSRFRGNDSAPEKAAQNSDPVASKDAPEQDINAIIERYDNYAKSNGFRLNPNRKAVEGIIAGLLANEKKYGKKYCPCRRVSGNKEEDAKKICPCAFHKEEIEKDGHCFCNLFVKK